MSDILTRIDILISDRFGKKHGRISKFSDFTGISHATITSWFRRGIARLDGDSIEKICSATGVSPSWLLFGTDADYPIDRSRTIPVIDWRTAEQYRDGENDEMILERIDAGHASPRAYALKMAGYDAMKPTIQDNGIVVIDPAVAWDDGDIVLVLTTATNKSAGRMQNRLGRIKKLGSGYILMFDNRDFPPLEIERNQVLGRAVELRTRL
jgi:SOS-response transcriptional repressor LexA